MGGYKTIAELNEGHNIHVVEDPSTGDLYVRKALSLYSEEVYRRLLSCPVEGIPKIIRLEKDGNALICIEEYVRGETLRDILSRSEAFSFSQIVRYCSLLCDILGRLHSSNPPIIHRDIKPSNIMVTEDGNVTLIDLNAAKVYRGDNGGDTVLIGTEGYAASEQYGFGESSMQTDIYAVGILVRELCESAGAVLSRRKLKSLLSISAKCTMMDSRQRYKDVASLKRVLLSAGSMRKFLPLGFRSGKITHAIPAILGYAAICFVSLTLGVENSSALSQWVIRIGVLLGGLSFVFCLFNYRDIHSRFPLCGSHKVAVRFFGALFSSFVISVSVFLMFLILSIPF